MGTTTAIEWADSTFNPWVGCTKVSPGCKHCYAETHPAWRADLFDLIRRTPHVDWLLLTKRIGNASGMLPDGGLPANVWMGASVVNQTEFDRDVPKLLAIPAPVRVPEC